MKLNEVRVRFAPSPTGFLHVGGLRTALFNYLFARKNSGKFILRIEDTDKSREVSGAVENIKDTLKIFGLNWDEGPIFQSQRLKIYHEHASKLVAQGSAYKCYCSNERIAELKKRAESEKQPFRYDKYCLTHPDQTGDRFVIRQNVPEQGTTGFEDLVYGKIAVENRLLDDGVLVKSDGYPVYNFANVIDDHLMNISHVIRGEEFIPSTPKHVLLYKAFGWNPPQFVHLPLLLNKERKKLSKRDGDVAVKEYLEKGCLPEAILNFVAFLGWNPKTEQEIFSLDELTKAFDLKKINKSGAVFDLDKLQWFNVRYIKLRSPEELLRLVMSYFSGEAKSADREFLKYIVGIEVERLKVLSEIAERTQYFFIEPEYDKELLRWKQMNNDQLKIYLKKAKTIVESKIQNREALARVESIFLDELVGELDKGMMLWPLRVALSGLKASPSPFEIMTAFLLLPNGKEEILKRIRSAIAKI